MKADTSKKRKVWSPYHLPFLVRHLAAGSRYDGIFLLLIVSSIVATVAVFVIRDLQASNMEAQIMYTGAVRGLQRIGELQYDTQETRRATLYALTTSDSNLQVEYADQSRAADLRVRNGIAEYALQANIASKVKLASRLNLDWTHYLHIRDEVLASILEGSTREAVSLDLTGGVPAFERVRQDLNEVKRLYEQDAAERLNNLVASSHRSMWRLLAILIFTFLLSLAAVWVIQRGRMLSTIHLAKLQMEFVASVSHELRTPLAVLSSASDNLADGLIHEESALRRYGAVLQHQSRKMTALVDQILLFASTEDRRNRYILHPVDVAQVLDSVLESTAELTKKDGFIIDRDIQPGLPLVSGDPLGISQCLQNLISNAVKYSGDERRIAVRGTLERSDRGSDHEVQISVIDKGIGIDRSELTRIFEPFYRSPRVNGLQIYGTGLGLSLAKRIAESMGGRITVNSGLSTGSTFVLHLLTAKEEGQSTASEGVQHARQ